VKGRILQEFGEPFAFRAQEHLFRVAFFAESRCITMRHVVLESASGMRIEARPWPSVISEWLVYSVSGKKVRTRGVPLSPAESSVLEEFNQQQWIHPGGLSPQMKGRL